MIRTRCALRAGDVMDVGHANWNPKLTV